MKQFIIIVFASLLVLSCAITEQLQALVATPTPLPTATPAATPTPTCAPKVFIEASSKIWTEFTDAYNLANSTARIALSPGIANMQNARRKFADLTYPDCANTYRQSALDAMDSAIDAMISFMGQESDTLVRSKVFVTDQKIQQALKDLKALQASTAPQ